MRKPIVGLWIVPDHKAEKPRWIGDDRLCYKTHIGQFEKNRDGMFVTNPAFQQWLGQNPQWLKKPLGEIELSVHEKEKQVRLDWFYPFGVDKKTGGNWYRPQEIFGKKGIGAFAFFRVLREAKEMFPDYGVRLGTTPTRDFMRPMLDKMGWKRPYHYTISNATKRARDYVAKRMREHRRK